MKKVLGISLVAVLAVAPFAARADIASTGYVTNAIANKLDKNSNITAGTATKITYDAKGLVTAGTTLTAADIPNITHTQISDFDNSVKAVKVDAATTADGIVSINTQGATNTTAHTNTKYATAAYVDEKVADSALADGGVTTEKLADGAVTTVKIADDAVTTAKIATGAVTATEIATGTITNTNISDTAAIAQSKIAGLGDDLDAKEDVANKVTAFSATVSDTNYPSEKLVKDSLDAKQNQIAAGTAGNVVTYSGTAGTVNSLGFDTTPTANSGNLLTSGTIKTALDEKFVAPASGTTAVDGTYVLTMKVVNDVPTYAWESINRTSTVE